MIDTDREDASRVAADEKVETTEVEAKEARANVVDAHEDAAEAHEEAAEKHTEAAEDNKEDGK